MKICICSSMAFYEKFMVVKKQLEELGHTVIAPELLCEANGDSISIGTFVDNNGGVDAFPPGHEIWKQKSNAITDYFRKIDNCDCILVTNYEKKGVENYIGGNAFLEMGYAYGTGKKVFILNDLPKTSVYKEEILGMEPVVLNGNFSKIIL